MIDFVLQSSIFPLTIFPRSELDSSPLTVRSGKGKSIYGGWSEPPVHLVDLPTQPHTSRRAPATVHAPVRAAASCAQRGTKIEHSELLII